MTEPIWITPSISPSELDGRSVELRVSTVGPNGGKDLRGKGRIRIQPHRATTGLFCVWVTFNPGTYGVPEIALNQLEANHIQAHPSPSVADYLCAVDYAESSSQ